MILLLAAAAAAAPLAVGEPLEHSFQSIDGEVVTVPDPEGRTVVLELIRSPEW